jgi:hypothetical protein
LVHQAGLAYATIAEDDDLERGVSRVVAIRVSSGAYLEEDLLSSSHGVENGGGRKVE